MAMNGRVMCMVVWCGVFGVLSGGCRSSHRTLRKDSFLCQDSLDVKRRDSIEYSALNVSALQRGVTICRVEFLPPDSLCRQFIRSVTRMEKKELVTENEICHLSGQHMEEVVDLQKEERREQMEVVPLKNESGKRIKRLLLILSGVLLFVRFFALDQYFFPIQKSRRK